MKRLAIPNEEHEESCQLIRSDIGLCPNCLRELCRRRRGRWKACRTSALGYGWPGRLRQTSSVVIPRFPCHPHLLRHRFTGFARQRPGEGAAKVLHLIIAGRNADTTFCSGSRRSCTSAKGFPSFSSVARTIFDTTRRLSKSWRRHRRSQSHQNRYGLTSTQLCH